MGSGQIRVDLRVEPHHFTRQTLPSLTVHGTVTNLGNDTIETKVYQSQLMINGKASMSWSVAIGNGTRAEREHALPPREAVEFSRDMGRDLFSEPGTYTLILEVLGVQSSPVTVTVADQ